MSPSESTKQFLFSTEGMAHVIAKKIGGLVDILN